MKFVNELVVYEASVLHLTCPSMVINYSSTEYPPIPELCIFWVKPMFAFFNKRSNVIVYF